MTKYNLKKSSYDNQENKYPKLPEGVEFLFQITDYKEEDKFGTLLMTKNGDPKVMITCEVVSPEEHAGSKVWHSVIFYLPESKGIKGIGMTRHFLHCIGESWEGDLDCDPSEWIPRRFKATIKHQPKSDFVSLDEIILDESIFGVKHAEITPIKPSEINWEE